MVQLYFSIKHLKMCEQSLCIKKISGVYIFHFPPPGGGDKNMSFQWVWGKKLRKKGKRGKGRGKEKREGEGDLEVALFRAPKHSIILLKS